MRKTLISAGLVAALLVVCGTPASVFAQAAVPAPQVRRLTVNEAVQIALENNLGVQIARIDPLVQDLSVAQARGAWAPTLSTTLQTVSTDTPNNSFLSGGQGEKTSDDRFNTNVAVNQVMPWGGSYSVGWDSARSTTTNIFTNFSPQLRSSLALNYSQPLLRGCGMIHHHAAGTPRAEPSKGQFDRLSAIGQHLLPMCPIKALHLVAELFTLSLQLPAGFERPLFQLRDFAVQTCLQRLSLLLDMPQTGQPPVDVIPIPGLIVGRVYGSLIRFLRFPAHFSPPMLQILL